MGSLKLKALLLSSFVLGTVSTQAMTDAELLQRMKKDTATAFLKIKAPRLTFHWVDASDITPKGKYDQAFPANDPVFTAYVDKQGAKLYNKRSEADHDVAGPGLYLASDPIVSRTYGGQKTYGLIVGVTKPEARIILTSYSSRPDFSNEVRTEINDRGCSAYDYVGLLDTKDTACTKIKQLLVGKDLSFADGRLYNFSNSGVPGCTSRGTQDFVPLTKTSLDYGGADTYVAYSSKMFGKVLGFTHRTKTGSDSLGNEVLSYLKGLETLGYGRSGYPLVSMDQLKDKSIKAMTDSEIKAFSKKYIINCK